MGNRKVGSSPARPPDTTNNGKVWGGRSSQIKRVVFSGVVGYIVLGNREVRSSATALYSIPGILQDTSERLPVRCRPTLYFCLCMYPVSTTGAILLLPHQAPDLLIDAACFVIFLDLHGIYNIASRFYEINQLQTKPQPNPTQSNSTHPTQK